MTTAQRAEALPLPAVGARVLLDGLIQLDLGLRDVVRTGACMGAGEAAHNRMRSAIRKFAVDVMCPIPCMAFQ